MASLQLEHKSISPTPPLSSTWSDFHVLWSHLLYTCPSLVPYLHWLSASSASSYPRVFAFTIFCAWGLLPYIFKCLLLNILILVSFISSSNHIFPFCFLYDLLPEVKWLTHCICFLPWLLFVRMWAYLMTWTFLDFFIFIFCLCCSSRPETD